MDVGNSYVQPSLTPADERHAGTTCPGCGGTVARGEAIIQCGACGAAHHPACWARTGRCAAYACAPGNRPSEAIQAAHVITRAELDAVVLTPPVGTLTPIPADANAGTRPKFSRGAIAAGLCAIGGIPLFGIVTGAVAVLLAALAFGPIRAGKRRGAWLAAVALLLGLGDMVGWTVVLTRHFGGHDVVSFDAADFRVSEADLKAASPPVETALRANVLITMRGLLQGRIGSGVILFVADGEALILTNRHVVDPAFDGAARSANDDPGPVTVQFVDGAVRVGRVAWQATGDADVALVKAPVGAGAAAARMGHARLPRIGDDVFAIGNPRGLGWTHTKGTVSQFRERRAGDAAIRVIQTSAPINAGNSGGGLYDAEGTLLGINTWAGDKRVSEGLGFAIAIESLLPLLPEWARPTATEDTSP